MAERRLVFAWERGAEEGIIKGQAVFFGGQYVMDMFIILCLVMVSQLYACVKFTKLRLLNVAVYFMSIIS